jgi:transposase
MTDEIEALARGDASCRQLMTVPGIDPIIASAMAAAICNRIACKRARLCGVARLSAEADVHG